MGAPCSTAARGSGPDVCPEAQFQLAGSLGEAGFPSGHSRWHPAAPDLFDARVPVEEQLGVCNDREIAALRLNPQFAEAFNKRGVSKHETGHPLNAIADFNIALQLNPNLAEAYKNRGGAQRSLGHFSEALQDLSRALLLDPRLVEAYVQRGNLRRQLGLLEGALLDYDEALRLDPDAGAYSSRATVLRQLGRARDAVEDYNQALELDPQSVPALHGRALSRVDLGRSAEALDDFDRALRLDPRFDAAYSAREEVRRKICDSKREGSAESLLDDPATRTETRTCSPARAESLLDDHPARTEWQSEATLLAPASEPTLPPEDAPDEDPPLFGRSNPPCVLTQQATCEDGSHMETPTREDSITHVATPLSYTPESRFPHVQVSSALASPLALLADDKDAMTDDFEGFGGSRTESRATDTFDEHKATDLSLEWMSGAEPLQQMKMPELDRPVNVNRACAPDHPKQVCYCKPCGPASRAADQRCGLRSPGAVVSARA